MALKDCSHCGETKPASEFYRRRSDCKGCKKARSKINRQADPGYFNEAVRHARRRAEERNLPFQIDAAYVKSIWTKTCPALGVELVRGDKHSLHLAHLDRIRPELGYVPGNVIWLSALANRIKSTADSATIRRVADWLELAE